MVLICILIDLVEIVMVMANNRMDIRIEQLVFRDRNS